MKTLLISALCASSVLFAQTDVKKLKDEMSSAGPVGITAVLAGPAATIPGVPYSAQAVTERIQVLADGNRITQRTTNKVARDSQGRVYREESLPAYLGVRSSEPPHLVTIDDPIRSLHISINSVSKTAYRMPFLEQKLMAEKAMTVVGMNDDQVRVATTDPHFSDSVVTTSTDLGTQTMDGLVAKGSRLTRTFPPGAFGNDLPLVITTETWFSPDLKIYLLTKSNDPRMGETTYKLTNLSRTEPDAALFRIPADYAIKDGTSDSPFLPKH